MKSNSVQFFLAHPVYACMHAWDISYQFTLEVTLIIFTGFCFWLLIICSFLEETIYVIFPTVFWSLMQSDNVVFKVINDIKTFLREKNYMDLACIVSKTIKLLHAVK